MDDEDRQDQLLRSKRRAAEDLAMVERALRAGWNLDAGGKSILNWLPEELQRFITDANARPQDRLKAIDILVKMAGQNQKSQHKILDKLIPSKVSHAVYAGSETKPPDAKSEPVVVATADELVRNLVQSDPDYLEYLRSRAVQEDSDAGALCEDREPGPLALRTTPPTAGP